MAPAIKRERFRAIAMFENIARDGATAGIPPEDCGASTFLSSEGLDDRLRHGLEPRTWTFRSDALPAGTGPFEQYR